jgi:hypothetical protein
MRIEIGSVCGIQRHEHQRRDAERRTEECRA